MLSVFSRPKSLEDQRLRDRLGVIYSLALPFIQADGEKCDVTQVPLNAGAYRYRGWQDWKWSRKIFMTSFIYTFDGMTIEVSRESVVDTWIKAANLNCRILVIQRDMRAICQRAADGDPLDPQDRKYYDELLAFLREMTMLLNDLTMFLADVAVLESSGSIYATWPDRPIAADLDLHIRKHLNEAPHPGAWPFQAVGLLMRLLDGSKAVADAEAYMQETYHVRPYRDLMDIEPRVWAQNLRLIERAASHPAPTALVVDEDQTVRKGDTSQLSRRRVHDHSDEP